MRRPKKILVTVNVEIIRGASYSEHTGPLYGFFDPERHIKKGRLHPHVRTLCNITWTEVNGSSRMPDSFRGVISEGFNIWSAAFASPAGYFMQYREHIWGLPRGHDEHRILIMWSWLFRKEGPPPPLWLITRSESTLKPILGIPKLSYLSPLEVVSVLSINADPFNGPMRGRSVHLGLTRREDILARVRFKTNQPTSLVPGSENRIAMKSWERSRVREEVTNNMTWNNMDYWRDQG